MIIKPKISLKKKILSYMYERLCDSDDIEEEFNISKNYIIDSSDKRRWWLLKFFEKCGNK